MLDKTLPSDGELLLLQALWELAEGNVQEVHEWIEVNGKKVGYTTVLKQLQRMHKKGLVSRSRVGKQHNYSAVPSRAETEAKLVDRLSQAAFEGSGVKLALKALGKDEPTSEELAELEEWLQQKKNRK
jgi:predicted transcriptional regulator